MGDFFLTHDDTGRAYFRRMIYVNVLFYIVMAFIFVVNLIDLIFLILAAASLAVASLVYALYFITKNPPY